MSVQPGRRRLLAAGVAAACGASLLARAQEKVVRITARKFEYSPAEVRLNVGEPVVLELVTEDVTMGFYLPDFKTGAEIVPGKVARVRLVPDRPGSFEFVCDVFCGEGHEDMSGRLVVTG